jgi:putative phosphonate catabolism associated alcohol dehydrogenase
MPATSEALLLEEHAAAPRLVRLPWREPRAGEVLVRILCCGLCASDVHTLSGRRPAPRPSVLGHEACGEVLALGPGVERDARGARLAPGVRVVWSVATSCGECERCRRGWAQKCLRGVKFGHAQQAPDAPASGGFAQVALLAPGTTIVAVPAQLDVRTAALAGCAVATAVAACRAAGELAGRRVRVDGAGMLGLAVFERARALGAAHVQVHDSAPARLRRALARGAVPHAANELVDVAFDCTGDPHAIAAQHEQLDIGGVQILLGSVLPSAAFTTPPERFVRGLLTLRGVHNYAPQDLLEAVDWLAANPTLFVDALGANFALKHFAAALAASASSDALRVFLTPEPLP